MSSAVPSLQTVPERGLRVPTDPIWRLNVDQYHAMVESGILTDEDPVELLEGWLVPKMPKNPAHRLATGLLREALEALVPQGWYVDSQEPVTTADSEPEPDVVVVAGSRRDYRERHPGPADLALVVEVADASLERDRTVKRRLYAEAGIPAYWIVNLLDRQVEVFAEPFGPPGGRDFGSGLVHGEKDVVLVTINGTEVGKMRVGAFLP